MTPASKKMWKNYGIGLIWLLVLLWPLLGIHADGTITFKNAVMVWLYVLAATLVIMILVSLRKAGAFGFAAGPLDRAREAAARTATAVPTRAWILAVLVLALLFPAFTGRYGQDVAINVLVYICLGLGLNIVVVLAGMLLGQRAMVEAAFTAEGLVTESARADHEWVTLVMRWAMCSGV